MEKQLILNRIQTPDGTILTSYHRHDYVEYTDKNGFTYMVDGGTAYQRVNVNKEAPHKDLSVYSDAPFEVIRESFHRGGRGKDGRQPLTWTPMSQMSDEWLEACIQYNNERNMSNSFANMMYQKELDYRKEHNLHITEKSDENMNTYDYIFWHNPYENIWYAIPRDNYLEFFNGNRNKLKNILSSEDIDDLVKTIKNK